jgi:agmatinase
VNLTFLNIPADEGATEAAPYQILPVPYEQTVSYGRGCAEGPAAIIRASSEVELFDEELESEPYRVGIGTLDAMPVTAAGPEAMVAALEKRVYELAKQGKTVITLGGEHSITPGPVRAYQKLYPGLSVLQIDAHADLRDGYQDCKYSHASAMMRVRDTVKTTLGLGIRNLSAPEYEYYKKTDGCHLGFAYNRDGDSHWINDNIDLLSEHVYVTIDLDGFDPSLMPAVGTPEPGGLLWNEVLAVLRRITLRRNVVAADVVELAPIGGMHAPDFIAAKLVYKLIAYIERGRTAVRAQDKA